METKVCSQCKVEKDSVEFHKNSRSKDALHCWCKECMRLYGKTTKRKEYETNRAQSPKRKEFLAKYAQTPICKEYRTKYFNKPEVNRRYRNSRYVTKYGITIEDYERMFSSQKGVCAVCGNPETAKNKTHLAVDHNHTTGAVRMLLCWKCNRDLGTYENRKLEFQQYLDTVDNL